MDELTLLRSVGEDVVDPSAESLDRGRSALVHHIGSRPAKKSHRGLKRAGWISGATVVAAGVAAALVLSNVVGLAGWRGGADAAAAAALSDAAAATINTSDPVVGPGQFLKVSTQAVYAASSSQGATGETGTYLVTQNGQVYIPADHNDDWVWVREPFTVAQTFGPASEKAAANDSATQSNTPDLIRAAEGAWYNGQPTEWGFDRLPRDPQQLLNFIYRTTVGQGVSPDGEALVFIADTLRTGVVPADLRAALYDAAAGIPGVKITDQAATLDGRTGIAFGRDESNGVRQEIIIDPNTGLMIGERQVLLTANALPGILAGESMGWTTVTTTVVDSAPSGGTPCGIGSQPVGDAGSGQCQSAN